MCYALLPHPLGLLHQILLSLLWRNIHTGTVQQRTKNFPNSINKIQAGSVTKNFYARP